MVHLIENKNQTSDAQFQFPPSGSCLRQEVQLGDPETLLQGLNLLKSQWFNHAQFRITGFN